MSLRAEAIRRVSGVELGEGKPLVVGNHGESEASKA